MTILEAINTVKQQTKGLNADEVFVIELIGIQFSEITPELAAELQKYHSLQMLTINSGELKSLKNLPRFPQLIRLELQSQELSNDDLNIIAAQCPAIWTLLMPNNNIKGFDSLKILNNLKNLVHLDVWNNPVEDEKNFRENVFKVLPKLEILDQVDKNGNNFTSAKVTCDAYGVPTVLLVALDKKNRPKTAEINQILKKSQSNMDIKSTNNAAIKKIVRQISKESIDEEKKQEEVPKKVEKVAAAPAPKAPIVHKPQMQVGKSSKISGSLSKRRNKSQLAGLTFPVSRVGRMMKIHSPHYRIGQGSKVYLAAVLEYLSAELLEMAGQAAKQNKKRRILPSHIRMSIRQDEAFYSIYKNSTLSEGGKI